MMPVPRTTVVGMLPGGRSGWLARESWGGYVRITLIKQVACSLIYIRPQRVPGSLIDSQSSHFDHTSASYFTFPRFPARIQLSQPRRTTSINLSRFIDSEIRDSTGPLDLITPPPARCCSPQASSAQTGSPARLRPSQTLFELRRPQPPTAGLLHEGFHARRPASHAEYQ